MILGWNWNDIRMIFGRFWDEVGNEVGMILGWSWDDFGMNLGWFWDEVVMKLGWSWDEVGMILVWIWDDFGMIRGWFFTLARMPADPAYSVRLFPFRLLSLRASTTAAKRGTPPRPQQSNNVKHNTNITKNSQKLFDTENPTCVSFFFWIVVCRNVPLAACSWKWQKAIACCCCRCQEL